MGWRENLKMHLSPKETLIDVYEFGVFTGGSMIEIGNVLADLKIAVNNFFGLDLFQGLPEDKDTLQQLEWAEGNFSSVEHFEAASVDDCMMLVDRYVRDRCRLNTYLKLIPGFYEESLTESIKDYYNMQPALYVDIDVDLYSSAITVLDFMFDNKLIQPGTIIGYDDWGGSMGWRYGLNGESRAHKEMCDKYNVECKKLFQIGNTYPHVHTAFEVIGIG